VYNGGIKRSYTLKVTGKNQGSNNLPLLLQALPDKIEWPSYPYYKVAGHHLQQRKDWPLPEETPPIEVTHNFKIFKMKPMIKPILF
jgi:hypothetical protein